MRSLAFSLALLVAAAARPAAAVERVETLYRAQAWQVLRVSRDSGVRDCNALPATSSYVHASDGALVLRSTVPVVTVRTRIDNGSWQHRPATPREAQQRVLVWRGDDLQALARHRRLRVRLQGEGQVMKVDLDLRGLQGALQVLERQCPAPASSPR
jgi:hypothetical protein